MSYNLRHKRPTLFLDLSEFSVVSGFSWIMRQVSLALNFTFTRKDQKKRGVTCIDHTVSTLTCCDIILQPPSLPPSLLRVKLSCTKRPETGALLVSIHTSSLFAFQSSNTMYQQQHNYFSFMLWHFTPPPKKNSGMFVLPTDTPPSLDPLTSCMTTGSFKAAIPVLLNFTSPMSPRPHLLRRVFPKMAGMPSGRHGIGSDSGITDGC